MALGNGEKFWTPEGAQRVHSGCPRELHRVLNLGSQREQFTALNQLSKFAFF